MIERWHLVVKDGLKVERLQFDSFRRLSNASALWDGLAAALAQETGSAEPGDGGSTYF